MCHYGPSLAGTRFMLRLSCGCVVFADDLDVVAPGSGPRVPFTCVMHGVVDLVAVQPAAELPPTRRDRLG